jgi:ABC-type nitrate/sulfonate/bicarbonate transport system substrate-binding protein
MSNATPRNTLIAIAVAVAAAVPQPAAAADYLTVMVFRGINNLAIYAAQAKGFYAKHGITLDLKYAPNSNEQRSGLAEGRFQIIHTATDNAVALVETARVDAAVVLGGGNGFNHLIVQPEIKTFADLRGKTLVVDSPRTAFALLLYEMLKLNGLNKGDYDVKPVGGSGQRLEALKRKEAAGGMMSPPYAIFATQAGLRDMGNAVQAIGAYQSDSAVVLRSWARNNSDVLTRYIKAHVQGVRWVLDPANKDEAIKLIETNLKVPHDLALHIYATATDAKTGYARDAKLDMEGFKNVLRLRADHQGQWGGKPPAPDKYIDLSYYQKAMTGL